VHTAFSKQIGLIKLFPGIPVEFYKSLFDKQNTKAIVLETYGAGNAPSDTILQEHITNYIQSGALVLNVTQVVQACYDLNSDNLQRELNGLKEAMDFFGLKEGIIVALNQTDLFSYGEKNIRVVSANNWLKRC